MTQRPFARVGIELLEPSGACAQPGGELEFRWRSTGAGRPAQPVPRDPRLGPTGITPPGRIPVPQWRVRVWRMGSGEDAGEAMRRDPVIDRRVRTRGSQWRASGSDRSALVGGAGYTWQVSLLDLRGRATATSGPGLFYVPAPDLPAPLVHLLCCPAQESEWQRGYGNPDLDGPPVACVGGGAGVGLSGSFGGGDAVTTELTGARRLTAGTLYAFSLCAIAQPKDLDYAKFRLVAHDEPLLSGQAHGAPGPGVTVVGVTGKVSPGSPTLVVLPPWQAPRDFRYLSVAAVSDAGDQGRVHGAFAELCIREISDCEPWHVAVDADGSIVLPAGALAEPPDAQAQHSSSDLGALVDVKGRPTWAGGTAEWYAPGEACASVGGWVPDDIEDHLPDDWASPAPLTAQEIIDIVEREVALLADPDLDSLQPITLALPDCARRDPAPSPRTGPVVPGEAAAPFAGRDIIFVHGFIPEHVFARIFAADPALRRVHDALPGGGPYEQALLDSIGREWPDDPGAFRADPDGYFRQNAEEGYWGRHIAKYVTGHPNRYLVAGFNCTQRLEYSIHAVLTQLAEAMSTGVGVRNAGRDDRDCFGQDCVIVTHSTGALLVDAAMSIAARTATDAGLLRRYGDLSALARLPRVHVSLHGAIGGSDIGASMLAGAALVQAAAPGIQPGTALAAAQLRAIREALPLLAPDAAGSPTGRTFLQAVEAVLAASEAANAFVRLAPGIIYRSVLNDLSPPVAKLQWGDDVDRTPVPTLCVVGAHPSFGGNENIPLAGKVILPGLDDGVVNANSQSGSPNLAQPDTFRHLPGIDRVYDCGIPVERAALYFVEQTNPLSGVMPGMAAYAASPFVSPTGMVQPVSAVTPPRTYRNHFRLLQSAADHQFPVPQQAGGENYAATAGARNYEETLVLDSREPIAQGLLDPTILALVRRYERRLDIVFRLRLSVPRFIWDLPPRIEFDTVELRVSMLLWRRLYDLMTEPTAPPVDGSQSIDVTATPGVGVSIGMPNLAEDSLAESLAQAAPASECQYIYRYVVPR